MALVPLLDPAAPLTNPVVSLSVHQPGSVTKEPKDGRLCVCQIGLGLCHMYPPPKASDPPFESLYVQKSKTHHLHSGVICCLWRDYTHTRAFVVHLYKPETNGLPLNGIKGK